MTAAELQLVRHEEHMARVMQESLQAAQAGGRRSGPVPDARAPYVAHMRIRLDGRVRDILLGACTYVDAGRDVRVIDWRTAPLARVFFGYRVGEAFDEEIGARELCGHLEQQVLVTFAQGRLVRIATLARAFCRDAGGDWVVDGQGPPIPRLEGAARGPRRARGAAPLERLMDALDDGQRGVVDDAGATPLLISGSAGTGKTTAALLRLAAWQARAGRDGQARGALVIAPERGLARAIRARLDHFRIEGVDVHTFDDWVSTQARRVFRALPARACTEPPPGVSTLKRHPALLGLLPRFVGELGEAMAARIDHALLLRGRGAACFRACPGPSLRERLEQVGPALEAAGLAARRDIDGVIARERERLYDLDADRLALIGDRVWLEAAVADAGGALTAHMVAAVLAHTRVQLSATTEEAYAHVDRERLRTLDARAIDEGTASEHAGTIDVEDFALMFELLRLKSGAIRTPRGGLQRYRHLIIDEAQELAPVELAVLGAARREAAVVSLAGDPAQQVSESSGFTGWDAALAQAGMGNARRVRLRHGHRCPRPIAELAHRVLGPLAPARPPEDDPSSDPADGAGAGEPVRFSVVPNAAHRAFCLGQALMALVDRAPDARVAVIARKLESARQIHRLLSQVVDARLVVNGAFSFEPGIDVTDVSQVKGLEFDVVVVPDASAPVYPDTPHARRLLHVAMTRAMQSLWVMAVGALTPLL